MHVACMYLVILFDLQLMRSSTLTSILDKKRNVEKKAYAKSLPQVLLGGALGSHRTLALQLTITFSQFSPVDTLYMYKYNHDIASDVNITMTSLVMHNLLRCMHFQ